MNNVKSASGVTSPFSISKIECTDALPCKKRIDKHEQSLYKIIWLNHSPESEPLAGNRLVCICPGQQYTFNTGPGCSGFLITFTEDFLGLGGHGDQGQHHPYLFRQLFLTPEMKIGPEASEDMKDVLLLLLKETAKYSLLRADIVSKYLNIFMLYLKNELKKQCPSFAGSNSHFLVNAFFTELENGYKDHRTVTHYAQQLFVTPNYLNHIIKAGTGATASYHIRQRILTAAKSALRNQSSMKEIAFQLGFEDMAHFSKFFKSTSGVNFTEFRRKINMQ